MSRVLILDDEAAIGRALRRTFSLAGFQSLACSDPEEALAVLRAGDVNVVVCDQRMPDMDGITFLERCAREFPNTVRILLTGFADAQVAADAINRAQVFRLLWKPWSETELVEAVRQAAWMSELEQSDREDTPVTALIPGIDD